MKRTYHNLGIGTHIFLISLLLLFATTATAQVKIITGTVVDDLGEPLIGATVTVVGKSANGAVTDLDGNFKIQAPQDAKQIQVSYVGYTTQAFDITAGKLNIQLQPDQKVISEVVVIGYGTARKSDLTGSVATIKSKDFNKGQISSAEQLINGKVAGVQIMSDGGSATSGSTIRVRGGASLSASNDPLIVIDGVPLESGGISGAGNFMSLINPADIESMTVLKDASSTAIYGSRASNGVIIITTKKGADEKPKISFTTTNTLKTRTKEADMLNRDEFYNTIMSDGTAAQKSLLGNADTNWNDEIFRTAFGTDNNVSINGKTGIVPFRVSLGYMNQSGLVKNDNTQRATANVVLSPEWKDANLKTRFDLKGTWNRNSFSNGSAIYAASVYNPTIPIYMDDPTYGGYNEAVDSNGKLVTAAVLNPKGLVEQYGSKSTVMRLITSLDVDYKLHFLPDLKLHATLGLDKASGKGTVYVPTTAASSYESGGNDYSYGPQKNENRLLTIYANYGKYFEKVKSNLDVTAGYDYQYWKSTIPEYNTYNVAHEILSTNKESDERHTLLSYYGRVNYSFDGRYLLTASLRRDGSSRFSKDKRWGTFPSVALGWTITNEPWMQKQKVMSNLKLRASYGVTGQQEVRGNYRHLPMYTLSTNGAQALLNGQYIYTYRPEAYISDLTWETTRAWNFGIDFGFLDNRISGSVDYYTRKTEDLLSEVPFPAGTNFAKSIMTNVGNIDSKGLEITLNATPIQTKDWEWNLSYNLAWQKMTVKNLSLVPGSTVTNMSAGEIEGHIFKILTEGYEPYMFYVYHQLYDENTGRPIEGAYADLNNDGKIDSEDQYRFHSPAPNYIMGLTTSLRWKKLTMGLSFRANIGNYVYNKMAMSTGAWETVSYNSQQLNNLNKSYLDTRFKTRQYLSDYYVENASFLKLDNLNISYDFGKVFPWAYLTASAMVQNVFCITKYSGVDPEISGGVDDSFYPRPRTYSLSFGLTF